LNPDLFKLSVLYGTLLLSDDWSIIRFRKTSSLIMLEKTEGTNKNGQSIDAGNIGHKIQHKDKQITKRNTEN